MRVISKKALREFSRTHPNAEVSLNTWFKRMRNATFESFSKLREVFPSADRIVVRDREFTIFNISGNKFRLIAAVHYESQTVYVRHVLTHAEYDRDCWKL